MAKQTALFVTLGLLLWLSSACTSVSFITQAAMGQWTLSQGRPVETVLADPKTPPRTRAFLREALRAKQFGARHGLNVHENYKTFVQLDKPYVVWFVNASAKLAFVPQTFWFPIVGSFPGLAWFDEDDAREFAQELKSQDLDVNIRGVTAFSTGGYFDDPLVSSMFYDHPAAIGFLVNTIIHESVHATVLVEDQQFFNESLASFVGNRATPQYLTEYYGKTSEQLKEYDQAIAEGQFRTKRMVDTFNQLNLIYFSGLDDAGKLRYKTQILESLRQELELEFTPNNATLIGFQLYQEGKDEFEALFQHCDQQWPRFLDATASLRPDHFQEEQTDDLSAPIVRLIQNGCEPLVPTRRPRRLGKAAILQANRQR